MTENKKNLQLQQNGRQVLAELKKLAIALESALIQLDSNDDLHHYTNTDQLEPLLAHCEQLRNRAAKTLDALRRSAQQGITPPTQVSASRPDRLFSNQLGITTKPIEAGVGAHGAQALAVAILRNNSTEL